MFLRLLLFALSVPLFWLGWLGILLTRAFSAFRPIPPSPPGEPLPGPDERLATMVILNWNGRSLLEEHLPSVVEAARYGGAAHEVLVVDNGSTDESAAFVRQHFPEVRVVSLPRNLGFGEGNNAGVREARHPIVVLLNNDMRVEPGFLKPLLAGFDEDVFAVSSQIHFQDLRRVREETGKTAAGFYGGWFQFAHQPITAGDAERSCIPVFWAGGGSSAFHREKFLALGGFDSLYSPCYVEDTDLSFRAWKRGWKVLLAPASTVHHRHRASSSRRFSRQSLDALILRNQILFAWVNLFDWNYLLAHGLLFPLRMAGLLIAGSGAEWYALAWAVLHLPRVLWRRLRRPGPRASDAAIFRTIRERFRFYARPGRLQRRGSGRLRVLMVTAYLPHLGFHAGAGRMFHLIQRLAARHDVSVLSFLENDEERERAQPLQAFCRSVRLLRRRPDYISSLYVYEPFDAFYSREMRRALLEMLEERDYDVIHFEYAQMGAYFLTDCPLPQIMTEHEVNFAACRLQARTRRSLIQKFSWYYNYMQVMERELRICRLVDKVIFMTEQDALELAGLLKPESIAVVRTGVDLDYFRPQQVAEEGNTLIFVGSFQHHPNVDAMLHFCANILPEVRKKILSVKLYIVGSRPPAELARLAEDPAIVVTGYQEDLRPHLVRSALYIVPLRLGVGIRGKILEAWAMERPVIATRLACSGLPVEHGENIWIADSDQEFASGIVRLLEDPALRQRLARKGRHAAESAFGWDAAARGVEKVYCDVTGETRGVEEQTSRSTRTPGSKASCGSGAG